ncbi:DUF4465 domain-containing protein [Myroides sp. NP-2]|uniref:DUF4465 domain-containing protein n=1 Tax=Myroides sp. NP-2 TaxID=2759945 RepID=UPI0015FBF2CD|nr:DUF4465 domain-containing protein [Myroides sp. NP-2]MBB1148586.1 DUF4465 domain-containing protein [Myroides sp. NP-2]
MKKQLVRISTLLVLGLSFSAITLTSCSNDDSSVYNINVDKGRLTAVTFEETVIDPGITIEGASYSWFDHTTNTRLSNEAVLRHAFTTPGEHQVSIKIEKGSQIEFYTYYVDVAKSANYDHIRLDLSAFDLSEGIETTGGKIWKETFTEDAPLASSIFSFSHNAMTDWNVWYGFTVSNSSDNTNHADSEGGWIKNQWGSMAQGGVAGKGKPFLVAYADHKPDPSVLQPGAEIDVENFSSVVALDNENRYQAVSTAIALSPWSYYGIAEGDDFATKFEAGDSFALKVYGVGADMKLTSAEPVTHYLVDFRNGVQAIDKGWKTVDLSSLGEVKYLLFFLETTDVNAQGYANTALYFTMDRLTVNPILN